MKYKLPSRSVFLSIFILLFASVLIAKLFYVQVVHSNSYSNRADRQYFTPTSDIFERGSIYFTRKDGSQVSAATQVAGYKFAISPEKITDVEGTLKKLSEIVEV